MFDLSELSPGATYLIQGELGSNWRYSGKSGERYRFWRWIDANRRRAVALSQSLVESRVWKEVQALDLSNLEAFKGE